MRMRASLTLSRSRLREGEPTGLPLSTAAHLPLATPASLGLAHLACHRRHDAAGCEVADPSPPILALDLAAPFLQAALMGVLCCAPLRSREGGLPYLQIIIWMENSDPRDDPWIFRSLVRFRPERNLFFFFPLWHQFFRGKARLASSANFFFECEAPRAPAWVPGSAVMVAPRRPQPELRRGALRLPPPPQHEDKDALR